MNHHYYLVIDRKSHFLFALPYAHEREEPALYDFMSSSRDDLAFDSLVREFYRERTGRTIHLDPAIDLLCLLLAAEANLVRICGSEKQTLSKNYFPVSYHGLKGSHAIKIGDFYRTSITNADEQFPRFCEWLNSLSSLPLDTRHDMELLVIQGYSLIALEDRLTTVLVKASESGDVLDAQTATISYLNRNSTI